MSKNIQSRIQHKHDIESNWEQAINFTPKSAELIVYDMYDKDGQKVSDHTRFKIGNDVSNVNDLPFNSVGITTPFGGSILNNCSSNINLSQYGTVSGDNCYVGCKGYNFNVAGTDSIEIYIGDGFGGLPANWEINDILGFKIGSKIYFALTQKITGFGKNNPVSIEVKLPISMDELSEVSISDRFVWNHNKPNNGDIHIDIDDTSNNAFSQGKEAAALGYASFSSGFRTIAAGPYDHAEGAYSVAQVGWSHAEGYNTRANGQISHSEGNTTSADGTYSHSQNYRTKAIGLATHAEGYDTVARGDKSHVEGWGSVANGLVSHAEGRNTLSIGDNSHAQGSKTKALGANSHAEGLNSITGDYIKDDLGNYLDPDGDITTDEAFFVVDTNVGSNAHAEGSYTQAIGNDSHTEGYSNIALGKQSHAEGRVTLASGDKSHTEGWHTVALGESQHVEGQYNIKDTGTNNKTETNIGQYIHIAGNGTSDSNRSNAYTLDWSGNGWFAGRVTALAPINDEHLTTKKYVNDRITSYGQSLLNQVAGRTKNGGEVFNDYVNNTATTNSHAEGSLTHATGTYSHAEGLGCMATGSHSHAEGYYTQATNSTAHAEGFKTVASSPRAHAEGMFTNASSLFQHVQGRYNVIDTKHIYAHIVGGGVPKVPKNENWQEGWNWTREDWTNEGNIERRNIHALDWYGNAYFAGDIYTGSGLADENAKRIPVTYTGTEVPGSDIGVDGDIYIMYAN